jgi:hypothetical protein
MSATDHDAGHSPESNSLAEAFDRLAAVNFAPVG